MDILREKIRQAGCKLTRPRLMVLEVLKNSRGPVSAKEVYKKVKNADKASVYRSLELFKELGIAQAENIGGENKFCLAGKPHHHIICEKCGRMEAIDCRHSFKHKDFFNIKHQLTLTGVCRQCGKNEK